MKALSGSMAFFRVKNLKVTLIGLLVGFFVAGCGGTDGTNGVPKEGDNTPNAANGLTVNGDSSTMVANFTLPAANSGLNIAEISVPLEREKTDAQNSLAASRTFYPIDWLWQYKDLLPHPELFCDEPTEGEFASLAAELGGFQKTTSIYIEKDATAPKIQSGLMLNNYLLRSAPEATVADGAGGVTIQRPNVVGRSGSKAFYLSDIYGLITVDYANVPFQQAKVSCALPLPGQPQNFVVTDDNLYAIIKDTQFLSSAVIQFDITGSTPKFVTGVLLNDQDVLDARLFNDTLVMYLRTYAPQEPVPDTGASGSGADVGQRGIATDIYLPGYSRQYLYHELTVFKTLPELEVTHRETFLPEGSENPVALQAPDPTAVYSYKYFNNFLSASGEYLLVSERVNERHFDGYETRTSYRCSDYKVTEVPYSYCRTVWDRVENPDYVPLPASGVLSCSGTLASCLKSDAPRVSRYIYVPNGQQCHNGSRKRYSCIAGSTVQYEVPQYHYETLTQVHAFRFNNGEFVRLDDQLARVNKDQSIDATARPFRLAGAVQKHDHMQFKGDNLYVITNDESSDVVSLHTLTIAGNSPVYVNGLTLNKSSGYSSLSAIFNAKSLYLSDGTYRKANSSALVTVSLADPLVPSLSGSVTIPTKLDQLFFSGNTLLGVGTIQQKSNSLNRYVSRGSLTSFTADGTEQNSLILGADYNYFYNSYRYDDQVITLDHMINRIFLPYTVSQPLAGNSASAQEYRLTVAKFESGIVEEEGTLNFPQGLDRTLSIDQESAFGFSKEFIHQLNYQSGWSSATILDGEIPESIYYTHQYPTQVQKRVRPDVYDFRLIDSDESASGNLLDKVSVSRATSQACFSERVLFDRDRIVVVQEAPNTYIDYQDCPTDRSEVAKVFTGYRIGAAELTSMTDQKEMELLYIQSQWHMTCVMDTDNLEGEVVKDLDLSSVDSLQCFTQAQYDQLLNDSLQAK